MPNNREDARADGAALNSAARNQVVFREVNERIASLTELLDENGVTQFICECSDTGCAEPLEVTAGEYETVRANGARFVIAHGHQTPAVEQIVDGTGRFLVVEKVGPASKIARAHDPRHQ